MKVRNTSRMSPEDFARHMNARHAQSGELANLSHIGDGAAVQDKDRATWEAYHRRLHDYRQYPHEHGE